MKLPFDGFPIMLAPMAGFTDMTYRALCREQGCDFTFSEMVSAKGLSYGGKSAELLETSPVERPCGIQLFGREPAIMADMAKRICDENQGEVALIDINMGCPAPKITGNGEGSALMKEPLHAAKVIEAVAKASSLPVSVKFRKGWDASCENYLDFAKMAEQSGASMVTLHGRTREQMYSGTADWDAIAAVKAALTIPVIGNGDVVDAASALALKAHTGCDGIMIGRGALGNPHIFPEIKAAIAGTPFTPPTDAERMDIAIRHIEGIVAHKGPRAVVEMRKHIAYYVRGMRGASAFRSAATRASTAEEMVGMIRKFLEGGEF